MTAYCGERIGSERSCASKIPSKQGTRPWIHRQRACWLRVSAGIALAEIGVYSSLMEAYKRETNELINRFLLRRLSFPECISALDSALAGLIPRLRPEDLPALRELIMANNERVMKEMERRGPPPKTSTAAT
jgi:hypothetical protein